MDAIFKRFSIRRYTDQKISNEDIEKLLKAGMQAPTAKNQQPWRFKVITNKDILEELSNASPYASFVKYAPLVIIITITNDELSVRDLAPIDAAIASENILLEAVHLGFGGTYLAVYPDKEREENVKRIINTTELPICMISLGYPQNIKEYQDRFDKEKITYID